MLMLIYKVIIMREIQLFSCFLVPYYLAYNFCLSGYTSAVSSHDHGDDAANRTNWQSFKAKYNKIYLDADEDSIRYSNFRSNVRSIAQFQGSEDSRWYNLGLSHLSDFTAEELRLLNGFNLSLEQRFWDEHADVLQRFIDAQTMRQFDDPPDQVDWRQVPARVSRVRDQGYCASDWTFAVAGALEGQEQVRLKPTPKTLIELSAQELIDCVDLYKYGCYGGSMGNAYYFIHAIGGIMSELSYPYTGMTGKSCKFDTKKVVITDYFAQQLPLADEKSLQIYVANFGPVSASVNMNSKLVNYKSGIFYDSSGSCDPEAVNHAVLVVGYGHNDSATGLDYWIVKNSWGSDWGEGGYFRLARNKKNMCGIATYSLVPTFDKISLDRRSFK